MEIAIKRSFQAAFKNIGIIGNLKLCCSDKDFDEYDIHIDLES